MFQNKGMAAMMVYQTNPPGIELYFYANAFFSFGNPIWLLVTLVKTLYWVSKFVLILWQLMIKGTAKVLCRIFGKFKMHCVRVVHLYVFFFPEGLLA